MHENVAELEQLLSAHFIYLSKLSKYTDHLVSKLRALFKLKEKGITQDEEVLHEILNLLREPDKDADSVIGRDFSEKITQLQQKIVSLNESFGKMIIDPHIIKFESDLETTPRREEIAHLFETFELKLDEMHILVKDEEKIISELGTIYDLAKKRNLSYICQHIEQAIADLKLKFVSQEKRISDDLLDFVKNAAIHEIPYHVGSNKLGAFYYSDTLTDKAVVICAGTTINYSQYEPLSYRLAMEGYMVLAINLPAHGNDMNFRIGNGAELIAEAVRELRSKGYVRVGLIGFSFGALASLYSLFGFDYQFEQQVSKELSNYVDLLDQGKLEEVRQKYDSVKTLVHESVLRSFKVHQGSATMQGRNRGVPTAIILVGMPLSLIKSKKLICPTAISITHGWMKLWTTALFNDPKTKLLRKIVNGLEHHQPIEEGTYENKDSLYMKFFEISSKEEFKNLKAYLKDVSKDPKNIIPLLVANQEGEYLKYFLQKIKAIPKIFMYGSKDAIASGSVVKEFFMRVFGNSKNIESDSVEYVVKSVSSDTSEDIKIYPGMGHTLDERKNWFKKLSRRPQGIQVQNDMVAFMKSHL